MKKPAILLLTAAAGAIAGPGAASNEFRNKYGDTTQVADCGSGDTVTYAGPVKLWPPNHKLQHVSMSATDGGTDGGSSASSLTVTPTLTDIAGGDGGPQHDPDWSGSLTGNGDPTATVNFALRAERSGKGEGRTYTLDWKATFDGGSKTCQSGVDGKQPFKVFVPHDMRGGANWK